MAKTPEKPAGSADAVENDGLKTIAELEERIRNLEQERDAALNSLREAEEARWMLDSLMGHVPEGIAFADAPNVRIRLVSRYGQKMTGRLPVEICGMEMSEHASAWGILHPDGTPAKGEELPLTRATLSGEVVRNEEWLLRRSDGREVTVLCNAGPVRDAEGRIIGGIIAWRDIDQLRLTKRTLRTITEYKLALDSARLGTWDYDLLARRFSLGERCRALFGTAENDVPYEGFLALFAPEERRRLDREIEKAASADADDHFDLELSVKEAGGTIRWLLVHAQAVFARNGEKRKSIRLIGCVMDITERKETERALRESEARFRGTFENAAVGIAHVGLDGCLLRVNKRMCDMLGYSSEELGQRTFMEITHPDDLEEGIALAEMLLRGEVDHFQSEKRYIRSDGLVIWGNLTVSQQRNEKGEPIFNIAVVEDITGRKATEAALRESEERLSLALDAVQGGVWALYMRPDEPRILDRVYISPQLKETIGFAADEFPDSVAAWYGRIHPDDRRRSRKVAQQYVEGEIPRYQVEYRIRHRDGSWRWILSLGSMVRDAKGRAVRWAGVDLNVTERKKMEQDLLGALEELRAVSRAKDEFVANISHELRTPLTVIVASLQLLHHDERADRNYLLEESEKAADQLLAIIDDLLDFSLIEREELEIGRRRFDLRACVKKAVDAVSGRAREKDLRLDVEIAPEVPERIVGDLERLGQVLFNFLDNAVKFTEVGGVDLRVGIEGENLHFSVRDTGVGIPEEKMEMVFDRFSQADASSTRKFGGTGLGLAISKGLVELMGGEVRAESREGVGSEFSFTLPLVNHQEPVKSR